MKCGELKDLIDGEADFLLIDVREPSELVTLPAISGSLNIPLSQAVSMAENGELERGKKIVSVCKSGYRCSLFSEALLNNGYDTDFLEGGVLAWNDFLKKA